jgi:hypothetical protein
MAGGCYSTTTRRPPGPFYGRPAATRAPTSSTTTSWTDSQNPGLYTALWNICATPAFLAKTTDGQNHPEVRQALQYHAYELYGAHPGGRSLPAKPDGYEALTWAAMPEPVANLEAAYRLRLAAAPKSRMAVAAGEIGWLFSGWQPDATLARATETAAGPELGAGGVADLEKQDR